MKLYRFIFPILFIALCACGGSGKNVDDDELIEDSTAYIMEEGIGISFTDLIGIYTGILPCDDCQGINATLILRKDSTYSLVELKQGTNQALFNNGGKWTHNDTQVVLKLTPKPTDRSGKYKIETSGLSVLDKNGNNWPQSDTANYFLKKN